MKRPKTYVVTEKQALRIFEGVSNCATECAEGCFSGYNVTT